MPNPPKHEPVRKRGVGTRKLPAEGRKKSPPAWPLPGDPTPDEISAWAQLWSTPQAVAWEQLGWTRTVARYCRVMVVAEGVDASAAILAQATALEDRLGLTPKAMRLLLWEITEDEVSNKRESKSNARQRVKAV